MPNLSKESKFVNQSQMRLSETQNKTHGAIIADDHATQCWLIELHDREIHHFLIDHPPDPDWDQRRSLDLDLQVSLNDRIAELRKGGAS